MENKIVYTLRENSLEKVSRSIKEWNSLVFNFMNSHDLYFFVNDMSFRRTINKNNVNFVDGFVISAFLSISNFRKVRRFSGTEFTISFLKSNYSSKGKHLFIGSSEEDLEFLKKKFPNLKRNDLFSYNPPFVKGFRFSDEEIEKMVKIIESKKIDFVWVGLGCPKQNFLSYDLSKGLRERKPSFFNVGAAMDFVLGRKKKAPKIFLKTGTEWLYRLMTDFNHSKKKVWRSFASLGSLNKVELEK